MPICLCSPVLELPHCRCDTSQSHLNILVIKTSAGQFLFALYCPGTPHQYKIYVMGNVISHFRSYYLVPHFFFRSYKFEAYVFEKNPLFCIPYFGPKLPFFGPEGPILTQNLKKHSVTSCYKPKQSIPRLKLVSERKWQFWGCQTPPKPPKGPPEPPRGPEGPKMALMHLY